MQPTVAAMDIAIIYLWRQYAQQWDILIIILVLVCVDTAANRTLLAWWFV